MIFQLQYVFSLCNKFISNNIFFTVFSAELRNYIGQTDGQIYERTD